MLVSRKMSAWQKLVLVSKLLTAIGDDPLEACVSEREDWNSWSKGASAREYMNHPKVFFETWYIKARELANCMTAFFQEDLEKWGHHMDALLPDPNDSDKYRFGKQPLLKPQWEDYGAQFIPLEVNEKARAPNTRLLARRKIVYDYKGVCCLQPIKWTLIDEDGQTAEYVCRENAMMLDFASDQWVNVPAHNDLHFVKTRLDDEGGEVDVPDRSVFADHGDGDPVSFEEDLNDQEVRTPFNRLIPPNKVSVVTQELFLEKVNADGERAVPCEAKGSDMFIYGVIAILPSGRKIGAEPVPLPCRAMLHNEVRPVQFGRIAGPKAYYIGIRFVCENQPAEEDELDYTTCKDPELWEMWETTTYDTKELRPLIMPSWRTMSDDVMVFTKPHDTDFELIVLFSILGGLILVLLFAYRSGKR
mmetsp:Transcript_43490/g.81669  ORF Transcript_43490/g.81669 Transcript_43490/m.81669 type:complete len:417 (+) Transcript_43490:74-1324(+)